MIAVRLVVRWCWRIGAVYGLSVLAMTLVGQMLATKATEPT